MQVYHADHVTQTFKRIKQVNDTLKLPLEKFKDLSTQKHKRVLFFTQSIEHKRYENSNFSILINIRQIILYCM